MGEQETNAVASAPVPPHSNNCYTTLPKKPSPTQQAPSSTHHVLHRLAAGDGRGELAGLVEAGAQQTGDLLDHSLRRQEGVVALGCVGRQAQGVAVVVAQEAEGNGR